MLVSPQLPICKWGAGPDLPRLRSALGGPLQPFSGC